jgi:hypothetical protein
LKQYRNNNFILQDAALFQSLINYSDAEFTIEEFNKHYEAWLTPVSRISLGVTLYYDLRGERQGKDIEYHYSMTGRYEYLRIIFMISDNQQAQVRDYEIISSEDYTEKLKLWQSKSKRR